VRKPTNSKDWRDEYRESLVLLGQCCAKRYVGIASNCPSMARTFTVLLSR
jgi:hypothetical protein